MLTKTAKLAALAIIAFSIGNADTKAAAILGGSAVVTSNGNVIATFVGQSAGFDSNLDVVAGDLTTSLFGPFFHNHLTIPGTTIDLGFYTAGTELIFRLNVLTTGDKFFSGPASRNPDGVAHAKVDDTIVAGSTQVAFEDIFGGGDRDYNDNVFSFSNVRVTATPPAIPVTPVTPPQVAEPGTLALFGLSLVGLGFARRRKAA
jgi:hypothetical protein